MFNRSFPFHRQPRDESRKPQAGSDPQAPSKTLPESPVSTLSDRREEEEGGFEGLSTDPRNDQRAITTISGYGIGKQSRTPLDATPGSLGLNIVYTPKNVKRKTDIVFIHGLGGTSRFTWSKNKNPDLFWPLQFLPLDRDISQARILSFGYDANFQRRGKKHVSISDFANELLFDLKFGTDDEQNGLEMGTVPLIFVVHSMGGLIIKEAYILGQNDPQYGYIIKSIMAIMFLATPHRGTNLATVLNWILTSTLLSNAKQYISDLNQTSIALQKLNDQFRHIAPKLDIVSLYETRPTPIGFKLIPVLILEKDAAVLGYPGEISRALDADHHNICKFDNLQDPNYLIVRNVLKSLVSKALTSTTISADKQFMPSQRHHDFKSLLAMTDMPDTDYIFFRDRWAEGTCRWILKDDKYLKWFDPSSASKTSKLLWLNGGPGTGKSVLSSFIIDDIVKRQLCCQYFFIRFSDQKKQTLSSLLRCLAYQLSRSMPQFLERALEVADEGIDFETADARTIWELLFKSTLFRLQDIPQPLYWIIDGVDEAVDPHLTFKQFSETSLSSLNVRILLVGRRTFDMSASFSKIPSQLHPETIKIEGHLEDVRHYVRNELSAVQSVKNLETIVERIVVGSRNNFLWVRLAVQKISSSHHEEDIDEALRQLPAGMEALYDRMARTVAQHENPKNRDIAIAILQCVTTSFRTLTIAELCLALGEDISKMLDIQRSMVDLCAGFVVIDNGANVVMVHQTAREYLLDGNGNRPLQIQSDVSHGRLFLSCMRSLMTVGIRAKVQNHQTSDFQGYSATCWSRHLAKMSPDDKQANTILVKFLGGSWTLIWIHYLSTTKHLDILVQTAQDLSRHFITQNRHQEISGGLDGSDLRNLALIEGWATDLVKIVGKFGRVLRNSPDAIYKLIPPFCPYNSSIFQSFAKQEGKVLSVLGMSSGNWDDSIARIPVGIFTFSLSAAGNCVAILAGARTDMSVFMYNSSTFELIESSPIRLQERVQRLELNSTGTLLATYGYRTTKIWDALDGSCKLSVKNIKTGLTPLTILFVNNSTQLLVGTSDRNLRMLDLTEEQPTWQAIAEFEEEELEGHYINSASFMALNREASLIAVGYRGHPVSAWEVDGPQLLNHCYRTREEETFDQLVDAAWNPVCEEFFGLYYEGTLFRWRPYDDECEELAVGASRLSISKDGNLIATGDGRGIVKIFTTADFDLIYRVTAEESVFGLAFGPDSRRIYDIRGYYCNAWEPNALINHAAQRAKRTDNSSETKSLTTGSTDSGVSLSGRIDSVTALAASPKGRYYCYGTDRGDVTLCDSRTSALSIIFTANNLSIEHVQWSDNGHYLAISYSGKRVVVIYFQLSHAAEGDNEVDSLVAGQFEVPLSIAETDGLVSQLLFDKSSKNLAISCSEIIQVICLDNLSDTKSLQFNAPRERKWLLHPNEDHLMIGVAAGSVTVVDWQLAEQRTYDFKNLPLQDTQSRPSPDLDAANVDETAQTSSWPASVPLEDGFVVSTLIIGGRKKHLLVQISLHGSTSKAKLHLAFDVSWLSISPPLPNDPISSAINTESSQSQSLTPNYFIPFEIADDIALLLNVLSQDRLVFLSRDFSIRVWQVPMKNFVAAAHKSWLHSSSSTEVVTGPPIPPPHPAKTGRHASLPNSSSSGITVFPDRPPPSVRNLLTENTQWKRKRAGTARSATVPKTLFYLPDDWICRVSSASAIVWLPERSLLYPRNGEVAMVRCSALG